MGNMKLRRRQYVVGTSGVAKVASRQTNTHGQRGSAHARHDDAGRRPARRCGPMLSTSMAAVTAPARLQVPTQSMPSHTRDRARARRRPFAPPHPARAVARPPAATAAAPRPPTEAMTSSTSWPQNSVRHPKYWITGEPSVTPRTGPPAPTSDHHPSALTRSSGVEQLEDDRHGRRAGGGALHAVEGAGEQQHADVGRRRREDRR